MCLHRPTCSLEYRSTNRLCVNVYRVTPHTLSITVQNDFDYCCIMQMPTVHIHVLTLNKSNTTMCNVNQVVTKVHQLQDVVSFINANNIIIFHYTILTFSAVSRINDRRDAQKDFTEVDVDIILQIIV